MSDDNIKIETAPDGKSFTVTDTSEEKTWTEGEVVSEIIRPDMKPAPVTTGEKIVGTGLAAITVAVLGAVAWFGIKQEMKYQDDIKKRQAELDEREAERKRKKEEREKWIEDRRNEGKIVVETTDGEYLAIPVQAYAEADVRKKGL